MISKTTLVELGDKRVASSARSGEYFREFKHLVFKKGKAMKIDKYLVMHFRSLIGTNKLLNAPEKKVKKDDPKLEHATFEIMDPIVESAAITSRYIERARDTTKSTRFHSRTRALEIMTRF